MLRIPFSKVDCSGAELQYVQRVLESGWLTTASVTRSLEEKIAAYLQVPHALAVNSCTSALHLALDAIGIGPGDRVLVPTWTFTTTAEVVRYMNADPIFADVDYGTCNLTPEIVARHLEETPGIKAVIVVHYAGQSAAMMDEGSRRGILHVCRQHGVIVIEDAAHAFPTKDGDRWVGQMGDITCLSFYANKTMTTGEGGMLLTHRDDYAARARLMRLHGIDRDAWDRYRSPVPRWEYDILAPGFKYNLPDLNAAVGLAQLERLEANREARQQCAEFYYDRLGDVPDLDLPVVRQTLEAHSWHLFPIVLRPTAKIARSEMIERLAEDGIGTSVHYKPLHRMTYYRNMYQLDPADFPTAERLWAGSISLPIYPGLTDSDLAFVVERIKHHLS